MKQVSLEARLSADELSDWRHRARSLANVVLAQLMQDGETADYAPEMPVLGDHIEGFIEQPFRYLKSWVPTSLVTGYYGIRVDTCVKKAAE